MQCALVLLMFCISGMLLTAWVALGYYRHGQLRARIGPDSLTLQSAAGIADQAGQLLLTADLVVGSGESFLVDGKRAQSELLSRQLEELAATELAADVQPRIASLRADLAAIVASVQAAAEATGEQRAAVLGRQLERLDAAANALLADVQTMQLELAAAAARRAEQLDVELYDLHRTTLWSVVGYLILLWVVWRLQVRTLVEPVRSLSDATEQARVAQGSLGVTPSGPTETRELTVSISKLFDRLRSENQRIEEVVAQRTRELVAANEAKDDFLATMSHELRTPLNGVIGMLDVLSSDALSESQREAAEVASSSSRHLQQLIDDMLDFSKLVAGRMPCEQVPCRLADIARDAITCIRPEADAKSLALVSTVYGDVPGAVRSDPLRVRQVLSNLLGNAVKFTDRGRVTLRVSVEERDGDRGMLRIEVSDTGIGMSADVVGSLYQPFMQADSGMTRRFGGTGLGLAITRRIVELLGGTIEVDSEPGRGSMFRVRLPFEACVEEAPVMISAGGAATASEQPVRVLLVEDNRVNQLVARRILEQGGYEVVVAENGQEAVAAVEREPFALILMDLQMPVMGGVEATRLIRELERSGQLHQETAQPLPVVAVTANTDERNREACADAGVDAVVGKPVRKQSLLEAVEDHLATGAPSRCA
ncbi:MAG: response regulator [Planctomycetes bacterium]|nr:response regulator [Planctomycetota bacterium]